MKKSIEKPASKYQNKYQKKYKKTYNIFPLLTVLMFLLPVISLASGIIDHSGTAGTLDAKWNQSFSHGVKQNNPFWLAYSVDKLMYKNCGYMSVNGITGLIGSSKALKVRKGALGKLIYGKDADLSTSGEQRGEKVIKEVAILFLFKPETPNEPETVRLNNMILPFESKGHPIYWLGKSGADESLRRLKSLYTSIRNDIAKKRVLSAIGFHDLSKTVIPFMVNVINSEESDLLRCKAANELGEWNDPTAISVLLKTAKNDFSIEVRRKAVNALEDIKNPAAVDALIEIANTANNKFIRKKAINCLGDVGTKKAADALYDIACKNGDIDLQRKAVNTFEDLPHNKGVPYLIKIAESHPHSYIRKKALDSLGESKDPRAIKAIKAIAKGEK